MLVGGIGLMSGYGEVIIYQTDDERLKGNGGGNYWKELLDRI